MRFLVLLVVSLLAAFSVRAAEPFTNFNVVLLQSSSVLEERVVSVDEMADYIKAIEAASRQAVAASPARQAVGGYLVVAVRPGQQSRVWLDFDALLDLEIRKQLIAAARAVKPFEARKGPVVFALKVAIWGGKETRRPAPLPPEWKRAQQSGGPLEVGELVEAVWDQAAAP